MIFEPSWNLEIGKQNHQGVGLLHKTLWPLIDDFDSFSATMNGTQIVVLPKEGRILKNLESIWEGGRGKLIWSRIIKLEYGPSGHTKQCDSYRFGIQVGENRIGFRLYADGRLESGLG